MKSRCGFTYAGTGWNAGRRPRPRPNRYRQAPVWRRLQASARGRAQGADRPLLNFPLRLLITALLIGISLAVLGKEPALRDQAAEQIGGWWESASAWVRSLAPVSAPPRPAIPAPAVPAVSMAAPTHREVKPLALISDGGVFVLGADGSVWPNTEGISAGRYPIVTGAGVHEVPGPMGVSLRAQVNLPVLRRILAMPYAEQLSEVNWGGGDEIVLYTRDAVKIKLENGSRLERDLRRLDAVLADLCARGVSAAVIDLRYLQQAVVKPRGR